MILEVSCNDTELHQALAQLNNFVKLSEDTTYLIFPNKDLVNKALGELASDVIQKAAKKNV